MTKTKTFIIAAILLACVSVFGAWTGSYESDTRYADVYFMSTYSDETISFTSRDKVGPVTTANNCPFYYPTSDMTNACGAVAGAEIVGFYDKYFGNLIPNWMSYYEKSGKYRAQDATYVPAVLRELYTLMRTNVDDIGVSQADFLNGLQSYINGKGYQVSYQSVKTGSKLNYAQCQTAIANNKVIVLFTGPTKVYTVSSGSNVDTISSTSITGSHVMVLYGYTEYNYYNNGSLFRSDKYLMSAVGTRETPSAYFNANTAINAAYIVNIQ